MSAAADTKTGEVEALDFESRLPCEGYGHKDGRGGHNPRQRGAIFMQSPCGCPGIVLCIARTDMLARFAEIKCERCDRYYNRHDFRFTYIPGDNSKH